MYYTYKIFLNLFLMFFIKMSHYSYKICLKVMILILT